VIIGIDLGTSTSAVAVGEGGGATALGPDPVIPSRVTYADGEIAVGRRAVELGAAYPATSFRAIKRLLGRKVDSAGVQRLARTAPFAVAAAPNRDAWVVVAGRPTPPQQLAAEVLAELRRRAEDHLDAPVTRAVVAVPAYFDDAQRQALRDAGLLAGLEVERLINEPTAAALAYGLGAAASTRHPITAAVFDLGGGTFDISLLRIERGVFRVLATGGDAALGGDDWDLRILELLVDEIFETHEIDASRYPAAIAALRDAAEAAKIALSERDSVSIDIAVDLAGREVAIHRDLSRGDLEALTGDLCLRLDAPTRQALADAGLDAAAIDRVLPVGGMTRAPMIRERIAALLGEPETPRDVDPRTAVAVGAAICGAVLAGADTDMALLDVTSQSLGLRIGGREYPQVVAHNDELPAVSRIRHRAPAGLLVVEVYRGEAEPVSANARVGTIELAVPEGAGPEVEIEVGVDVDSMVRVSLCEPGGAPIPGASGRLRARAGLSDSQLERFASRDLLAAIAGRNKR
jgi:molecular chaperone DnaK